MRHLLVLLFASVGARAQWPSTIVDARLDASLRSISSKIEPAKYTFVIGDDRRTKLVPPRGGAVDWYPLEQRPAEAFAGSDFTIVLPFTVLSKLKSARELEQVVGHAIVHVALHHPTQMRTEVASAKIFMTGVELPPQYAEAKPRAVAKVQQDLEVKFEAEAEEVKPAVNLSAEFRALRQALRRIR